MPRSGLIRVGCAGWSIPRGSAGSLESDGTHLQRYAVQFSAVEINSSFHRPHRAQTYARWAASVGTSFRFSVKVPKQITHKLKLKGAQGEVEGFLESIQGLGKRLGCLLVQLPPSLALDVDVATPFFAHLCKLHSGAIVCEPRHASWFTVDAESFLREYDIARVAADPSPIPGSDQPGGSSRVRYFRLHGSPRMYYSSYEPKFLTDLAAKAVSERKPGRETWCIFDNTAAGFAMENAIQFQSLVGTR
jgi:uncharacterized protein YecE (DUF72 family)